MNALIRPIDPHHIEFGSGTAPRCRAMVKRALCHAMPDVGWSRAPLLISDEVDRKVKEISQKYVEAVA